MISDDLLRTCLAEHWRLHNAQIVPHHGGMNSGTWFVTAGPRRWVAKAVAPDTVFDYTSGLAAAAVLDRPDLPTGAPERSRDGRLAVTVEGMMLALLAWVPGEPVTGDGPAQQRIIGTTLARAHAALRGAGIPSADSFHWVDPEAEHLDVRDWVRPAVTAALTALDDLDPATLTWGPLHTDPAPEALRLDQGTGTCGLIDWSTAMPGPYLYDLASAVMYVGGPDDADPLIEAYLAQGVLARAEVERGLTTLLRFRWAVQADYFARRIAARDLTGIADHAENEKGLEDARRSVG
ncbi:phosphotransferase enzyme family protein [Glycomyces tritici]|uniref:Phosphotransferase n=1 Tax=Glycomyces tritici TaxID=2665176 RepID=A0ABT7YMR4_9ACTN|nr:phosphotransferase [Glycomyces tritici]MDN3239704.1 phosphotransferase [Glycomyces tritici]